MNIDARQEDFERVELFGKPALFTNARIDRMTVPQGLYCYDLRGSDNDPGRPATVEPKVGVNHAGAVITAEPVDFKGRDYRPIRGKLNFWGDEMSVMDFLAEMGMEYIPQLKYKPRAAAESDAALFFSGEPEDDARIGCVGHMRFDFGSGGEGFWHTWQDHAEELKTGAFKRDLKEVVDELREKGPLKDLNTMAGFCRAHENARFSERYHSESYGFALESDNYCYYLRCFPRAGDYSYLYCYDKETLRMGMTEQSEPQSEGGLRMGGLGQ